MENNIPIVADDELLVKYLTGTASASEREEALVWIRRSKENKVYFDQLRDVYEASKLTQSSSVYNANFSWEKVKVKYYKNRLIKFENDNQEEKRFFIQELFKYAAISLVILTLGVVGYKFLNRAPVLNNAQVWNEVEAPFGSRTVVNLADGTKVWLNSGSKLRYEVNFGQKNRNVFLSGEAYFNVAKNKDMQFIVKTSYLDVKVYGTEFNVKAYPEENTIQTTLVRGSITIEGAGEKNLGKEIKLRPNQSITYIKDIDLFESTDKKGEMKKQSGKAIHETENLVLLPKIDPVVFTSWKDSKWIIEGETLASLAIKLERRYNVKFEFKSQSLAKYKFTGSLKDETLEQVLKVIKIIAPIEYNIEGKTVYLNVNKSFKKSYDELLINRDTTNVQ